MALAQRQFYLRQHILCGIGRWRRVAYFLGYHDLVFTIFKWALSGTGLALIVSALNITKLYSFKCPRCDEIYFCERTARESSRSNAAPAACRSILPADVDLTP